MEHAITLITTYGYLVIFPLAIIEGPIITIIGGFLVSLGLLNPLLVYIVVIAGDIVGDALYYAIGRYGKNKFLRWVGRHIGLTEESFSKAHKHFVAHGWKTLMAAKLIQGVGVAGLVTAGAVRMPYARYMLLCLSVSALQSMLFLGVGIVFGHAYLSLNHYLNVFATSMSIAFLLCLFLYIIYRLKSAKR
jgi:membrane protein DedA with SNARE-associated domain